MRRSLEPLVQDLGYAVRSFRRSPAFVAVALLSLTLGIGATTAIFSVVHGVLMKPLPYRDPGLLANIWVDLGVGNQSLPAVSPGDFRDYQQRSQLFAGFAAVLIAGVPMALPGGERVLPAKASSAAAALLISVRIPLTNAVATAIMTAVWAKTPGRALAASSPKMKRAKKIIGQ